MIKLMIGNRKEKNIQIIILENLLISLKQQKQ